MADRRYFVIADTHFNHERIIKYCNRPFPSVEKMNETIIKNWNNTVAKQDRVFMLGDFGFGRDTYRTILPKLNGSKILIKGNHDHYSNSFLRECGFEEVSDYPILVGFYLMSHAPLQLNETTPYFNYYGHVHNDNKFIDTSTSKCVSVERINYTPFEIMAPSKGE